MHDLWTGGDKPPLQVPFRIQARTRFGVVHGRTTGGDKPRPYTSRVEFVPDVGTGAHKGRPYTSRLGCVQHAGAGDHGGSG